MRLKKFIEELKRIMESDGNLKNAEVCMADKISVTKPVYKGGKIYISDIEN